MTRRLAAITLTLLFTLFPQVIALAHAELESSDPAEGSVVEVMPKVITLTFGEKLLILGEENVNTITLTTESGSAIPLSSIDVSGEIISTIVESTPDEFAPGKYLIQYRVVSTDGHPIKGEVEFEFAPPELVPAEPASPAAESPSEKAQNEEQISESGVNLGLIVPFVIVGVVGIALLLAWIRK